MHLILGAVLLCVCIGVSHIYTHPCTHSQEAYLLHCLWHPHRKNKNQTPNPWPAQPPRRSPRQQAEKPRRRMTRRQLNRQQEEARSQKEEEQAARRGEAAAPRREVDFFFKLDDRKKLHKSVHMHASLKLYTHTNMQKHIQGDPSVSCPAGQPLSHPRAQQHNTPGWINKNIP